jgi:hypothetical protein
MTAEIDYAAAAVFISRLCVGDGRSPLAAAKILGKNR